MTSSSPWNSYSYLGVRVYLIIYLLSHPTVSVSSLEGTTAAITPSWIRHFSLLFSMELLFPGYLGVRVNFIINLIFTDCLHDFLFYVDLASHGYAGF